MVKTPKNTKKKKDTFQKSQKRKIPRKQTKIYQKLYIKDISKQFKKLKIVKKDT